MNKTLRNITTGLLLTILFVGKLSAQTIIEDFNYFVAEPLTSNAQANWIGYPNGSCSPDLDGAGRIKSKLQCSFGTNLAGKAYSFGMQENDTSYIYIKGGVFGASNHLASFSLDILSTTQQNFAFGLKMNNGQLFSNVYGTNGTNGFSYDGTVFNLNAEHFVLLQIIWVYNSVIGTYGKASLHYLTSGKNPTWVQDAVIGDIDLPFTSMHTFDMMFVNMTGSGSDLRSQIDDILYDNKKGVVTSLSDELNEKSVAYPNPFTESIQLSKSENWSLYNNLGQLVLSGNSNLIETGDLSSGVYHLRLENGTSQVLQKL